MLIPSLRSFVLVMVGAPHLTRVGNVLERNLCADISTGRVTHCVFICFGLFTNILVTLMLVVGGSAVVTSLTGMSTEAACFLLPLGVVLYTMFGG